MGRASIDPETKAQAIADLMDGDQPAVVAARYGIPSGTVRQWKNRLVTPDVTDSVTSGVTPKVTILHRPTFEAQQLEIGELIKASLRAKIFATQKIAEYVTTPAWLDKQGAADVATLFEAIDRAAIGVLDRMAQRGRADTGSAAPSDDGDRLPGGDLPGDR